MHEGNSEWRKLRLRKISAVYWVAFIDYLLIACPHAATYIRATLMAYSPKRRLCFLYQFSTELGDLLCVRVVLRVARGSSCSIFCFICQLFRYHAYIQSKSIFFQCNKKMDDGEPLATLNTTPSQKISLSFVENWWRKPNLRTCMYAIWDWLSYNHMIWVPSCGYEAANSCVRNEPIWSAGLALKR